ncbi:SurA N-terminal domain-containing protein [bacterium]|nr:SurA N-terminal domain-containing protein [bacterium]
MVMLKAMRKKTRMILWGTIILVIPTFILAGALVGLKERRLNLVAAVNGKGITGEAYYKEVERLYREMREGMGDKFNEEIAKILNLEEVALNILIERELLLQEVKRKRIGVSDQELREEIRSYPAFQKEGKFDKETYFALLDWLGYTPQKFEEEMSKEISITKLKNLILDGIEMSEKEIRDEYLKRNEEIEIEYLLIAPAKEVRIDQKEIEKYYQENKESYRVPEKIRVRHVLIKGREARERIKEITRRLGKEEDFEKLAKEFSQCPSKEKGGDLGFFKRGDMVEEFEGVAFGLEEGQISRPVKSRFGYHIIKLEEKKESYIPPLDEVKEKIKRTLKEEKGWRITKERTREVTKEIEKEDLRVLAKRLSVEIKETGLFKRGESNLPQEIEEEALGLKVGEVKGPLRGRDGYYIIRLIKRKGMDKERFAEEKEAFTKDFIQKKKALVYSQWYRNLYQKAKIKIHPIR